MKNVFFKTGLILSLLLFSRFASAEDIADMFKNSANTWESGIKLARGIAMLCGVIISGAALMKLKEMSVVGNQTKAIVPISLFFIGAALITITTQIDVASETLSLSNSASDIFSSKGSQENAGVKQFWDWIGYVTIFFVFLGNIAFIRSFFIFRAVALRENREATLPKALVHLIGGVALINFNATAEILVSTFAPSLMA